MLFFVADWRKQSKLIGKAKNAGDQNARKLAKIQNVIYGGAAWNGDKAANSC